MKLLLDANNTAFRANVTSELTTKQGERVSAIHGVLKMTQSYLKPSQGPYKNKLLDSLRLYTGDENLIFDDALALWDFGRSEHRMKLYPEYKRKRDLSRKEKTPEEKAAYSQFLDQMNQLHEILPAFGVRSIKIKGQEGDDLLYVVTELTDDICVIVSTDKDMLQLVSDKIFIWSPIKEQLITPKNFTALVGIPIESYLTYRILVGDSSDNIDGIQGIGDKTAKSLTAKYINMDGILQNQPDLIGKKATARIFENLPLLQRNDSLMNLNLFEYGDIKDHVQEVMDEELEMDDKAVKEFLMSKQFVQIMADFISWTMPFRMLGEQE